MSTRTIDTGWMTIQISATGVNGEFRAATDWFLVDPTWDSGRGWLEVQGISGTGTEVAVAIELANNIESPTSPHTKVMTVVTSNGVKNPDSSPTTINFAGAKYARAGFHGKVTSGNGFAHVRGKIQIFIAA